MPDRFPGTWADVAKGDYVESVTGQIWKVTHQVTRDDGRYLGIKNAAGEQKIIGPDLGQSVIRLVYGDVTEEEAVATVQAVLGGEVIHPGRPELVATGMLEAHLVRFHSPTYRDLGYTSDELEDLHIADHAEGKVDHTHRED